MKQREWEGEEAEPRRGIGGFVRSLLRGIPWSERAEAEETVVLETPPNGKLRVDNANGRTHVIGEDRGDIEVRAANTARAESEEAAQRLVDEMRVVYRKELADALEQRLHHCRGRMSLRVGERGDDVVVDGDDDAFEDVVDAG